MNNTLHIISAALVVLFGSLAAFDWSSFVSPAHAAEIVTGLGAAKLVFGLFAPSTPAPSSPLATTPAKS